jgi:integrase
MRLGRGKRFWAGGYITESGVYRIRRVIRGERVRCSTGCRTPEAAAKFLAALESGEQLPVLGEGADLAESVREFLTYQAARRTGKYVEAQARSYDLWRAHLGDCTLESVTVGAIHAFVEKRRFWGVGVAATNRDLAALSKLFAWARQTDRTEAHPFAKVHQESEKKGKRPHRWVPHAQIMSARASLDEKWSDALTVLYGTGFRWSSFARLTVGTVDVARSILRDPEPKGTQAVEVAVSPEVLSAARRCLARPSRVIEERVEPPYPDDEAQQFGRRLAVACRAAGVPRFTAHDLRVSAASWMYENGVPLKTVQQLLGHASVQTTERYIRAGGAVARGPI